MNKFSYLKAFCSPFKRPKLKWYFGPVAIGTPYFFPRKAIKDPDKPGYLKFVPKKIGFDFVRLGWKTKWTSTDYRFEWAPLWSFVFFGKQIAVIFKALEQDHYWEAWLYYENHTDKSLSKEERIELCKKNFPLNYTVSQSGKEGWESIDYYTKILKPKYLK
jgi:hypothetical protein